jgi:hypothetical protein
MPEHQRQIDKSISSDADIGVKTPPPCGPISVREKEETPRADQLRRLKRLFRRGRVFSFDNPFNG